MRYWFACAPGLITNFIGASINHFFIILSIIIVEGIFTGCVGGANTSVVQYVDDQRLSLPIKLTDEFVIDTTIFTLNEPAWSDTREWIDGYRAPILTQMVRPVYPPDAAVAKDSGTVIIRNLVDTTGRVVKSIVVKSTNTVFNKVALRAAIQQKYKVDSRHQVGSWWVLMPFRFKP